MCLFSRVRATNICSSEIMVFYKIGHIRKILNVRGLFKSKKTKTPKRRAIYIHSNVNGAWNMGRKLLLDLFKEDTITREAMLNSPLKIKNIHDLRSAKYRVNDFYDQFKSHDYGFSRFLNCSLATNYKVSNALASV